jgi:hypothetical protein
VARQQSRVYIVRRLSLCPCGDDSGIRQGPSISDRLRCWQSLLGNRRRIYRRQRFLSVGRHVALLGSPRSVVPRGTTSLVSCSPRGVLLRCNSLLLVCVLANDAQYAGKTFWERGAVKTFRHILLSGWAVLTLMVLTFFTAPKLAVRVLHPIAHYFALIPFLLLLATAAYKIITIYRAGISRSSSGSGPTLSG